MVLHLPSNQELRKYKKNITRASEIDSKELSPKSNQLVVKKFERKLNKLEERIEGCEGRINSMWQKFVESGLFGSP